jgi:hypothetical protein
MDKLTPEQLASIDRLRAKWLKIGLNTDKIKHNEIKQLCYKIYEDLKKARPRIFIFTRGPTEAMYLISGAASVTIPEAELIALSNSDNPYALTEALLKNLEGKSFKEEKTYPSFYGQHDASWLSFYDFFVENFNIANEVEAYSELAKVAGWCWFYEDIVFVSHKPYKVSMIDEKLHSETGPAVAYDDGTKIYAFNGTRLPGDWVENRNTIDPGIIFQHTDVDVRAAGIQLLGYARLKDKLGYKILDGDPKTDIGALVELSIPGLPRPGRFLEAVCPRNGPVFLGVPEVSPWDNKKINTPVAAQAFLAGIPSSAYEHPPIRT